ncbi:hypothetical protein N7451_009891 [Penicillium sp. IBT 35674x]|nr:hypothetical protein N7451_009891 [Penicillium sp. IBT 35674x]
MAGRPTRTVPTRPPLYGPTEEEGAQRRRWIDDPSEPGCSIERSTLTYSQIVNRYEGMGFSTRPVDPDPDFEGHVLTAIKELEQKEIISTVREYENFELDSPLLAWSGCTGSGVITIDVMMRSRIGGNITREMMDDVPHASCIAQAFYQRDFEIDDLRSIFVNDIINRDTVGFFHEHIYDEKFYDDFPGQTCVPQTWEHGSPEYDGLLGTRIGKVVAYLVLGAFPRGTRRISRIVTYSSKGKNYIYMRFDLDIRFDIEVVA